MNMIGHYDGHFQAISSAVIVNAASQHNVARPLGQDATKLGAKRDEVRCVVALHVRQIATIELH